ncbi:MAG: thioredoxin [Mesorhizobium amorphae]|nr:MAG: thioredoxin [Mesorhizobium amorphae]
MSDTDLLFGGAGNERPAAGSPQTPAAGLFGGAPQASAQLPKDVTTAGFAADVIQESRRQPVLVDFWAPWCGPCKQLQPALEKVVAEAQGRVKLVKMNIDEHPSIAGQLGIQSIPAVIAFKNGQPVDGFMGAVPESQIRQFIDKIAGGAAAPGVGDALEAAKEALAQGDAQTAMQIFDAVLAQEPENLDAIAGLAGLLWDAGEEEAAEEVLAAVPEGKGDAAPITALRAKIALAAEARKLGDPRALERRLAADPADHQARFDLAVIQNALGEREQAAENLLAIIKADRAWNEDGARAQLLRFFEAWGNTDKATLMARRRLSSLLFS